MKFDEIHPGVVGPVVTSIEEYLQIVRAGSMHSAGLDQDGYDLVYRGIPRTSFGVHSQLALALARDGARRRSRDPAGQPDWSVVTESRMARVEDGILELARLRGLHINPSGRLTTPELLAVLRHHGAPVRLIDFSADPLIALWFAVSRSRDDDHPAFVVVLDAHERYLDPTLFEPDRQRSFTTFDRVHPITRALPWHAPAFWETVEQNARSRQAERTHLLGRYIDMLRTSWPRPGSTSSDFFAWNPGGLDPRMVRQHGSFVYGRVPPAADGWTSIAIDYADEQMWRSFFLSAAGMAQPSFAGVVLIPEHAKQSIRLELEEALDIGHRQLFPDPSGLAEWLGDPTHFADLVPEEHDDD